VERARQLHELSQPNSAIQRMLVATEIPGGDAKCHIYLLLSTVSCHCVTTEAGRNMRVGGCFL
ncbi:MAG: hypothetical protein ABR555_19710, partial [Pyrinomonadaceae bacterium]